MGYWNALRDALEMPEELSMQVGLFETLPSKPRAMSIRTDATDSP
jgi:hypothetical protein